MTGNSFVRTGAAALLTLSLGLGLALASPAANLLSPEEQAAGWRLLFDGRTPAGWRSFGRPAFPVKGWVIEDGWLKNLAQGGGDLVTESEFNEFELQFEWRVAPKANSGLKYFIREERGQPIGHEYQILDQPAGTEPHPGATAGFYDCLAPTSCPMRPAGEVNESRILVRGQHVEHWLNGVKTLEYELGSPTVRAAVARSKFKAVAGFGERQRGRLLLQDHGGVAWFRSLKVRVPTLPASSK